MHHGSGRIRRARRVSLDPSPNGAHHVESPGERLRRPIKPTGEPPRLDPLQRARRPPINILMPSSPGCRADDSAVSATRGASCARRCSLLSSASPANVPRTTGICRLASSRCAPFRLAGQLVRVRRSVSLVSTVDALEQPTSPCVAAMTTADGEAVNCVAAATSRMTERRPTLAPGRVCLRRVDGASLTAG